MLDSMLGTQGATDSGSYTPEGIDLRRRMALAMIQAGQSDTPVRSAAQGWNRVLQQMLGTYRLNQLDKADAKGKKDADELLIKAFGGGGSAPTSPTSSAPMGGTGSSQPESPGGSAAPAWTPTSAAGDPADFDKTVLKLIGTESGGDDNAKNPRSSATGAGQFIDSTWLATVKKHAPNIAAGKSDAELLALRSNGPLSREMTAAYARDNLGMLQQAGLEGSPGNIKLAHFAGPGGAVKVLRADPSTPVEQVLGADAVSANPFLRGMTAGDVKAWADRQMGGGGAAPNAQPAAGAPAVMPQSGAGRLQQQAIMLMQNPRTAEMGRQLLIKAATAEAPKQPEDVQEYMLGVQQGYKGTFRDWQIEMKQAGRSQTNVSVAGDQSFTKELNSNLAKDLTTRRGAAQSAVTTINSLNDARTLLDSNAGVITGTGADWKLAFGKALQLGGFRENDDLIANTEAFGSQMANQVLSQIKTLGANPSNADREFIEKAAGGKVTLTEQSIRRILDIGEKSARNQIKTYNQDAGQVDPKSAPYDLLVQMPADYEKPKRGATPGQDQPTPVKTQTIDPATGNTALAPGAKLGGDQLKTLPDGAVIRDGAGKRYRVQGGQPVPIE